MANDPIGGVLRDLDEIIAWSSEQPSRAGYFASLYRRVTATVRSKVGTGYFDDDRRIEDLDVTFARRYLDAFARWRGGDPAAPPTPPWQVAFTAVADDKLIVLQHLLVGINAHINYDLGIAAAEIAPTRSRLDALHDDFAKINRLLACLVPTAFAELGEISPLIRLLEKIDAPGEESLVNLFLRVTRDFAWLLANELVIVGGPADPLGERLLAMKAREVAMIGSFLLDPGRALEAVIRAVRVPESKDVRRNIAVLNAPEMMPADCG